MKMESYHRIQKTLCEMFEDRHYTIQNKVPIIDSAVEVSLLLTGSRQDGERVDAFIIYKKMGKNEIIKFFTSHLSSKHIILVSKEDFTSFAKQILIDKREEGYKVEFFLHKELLFNITKHKFQPKFELMKQDDVQYLLKQLQCKLPSLNKMMRNDPVARYYDAQPKQVFKITRDFLRGDNHQHGLNYRVVV